MRLFVPLVATALLSVAACGGSSTKAAHAPDATDESTAEPTSAPASAENEDAVIVTECTGLDEFTCSMTGGCEWSASKKSCGKQAGR